MRRFGVIFTLGIVVFVSAVALAQSQDPSMQENTDVVVKVCTRCHSTDRICPKLGNDALFWTKTVDRMKANGALISAEEREVVEHWLAAAIPGDKPICQ